MKRLAIIFCILCISIFTLWKAADSKNKGIYSEDNETEDDDTDSYRDEFVPGITGPRGERVFIGAGGGRYYTKDSSDMYAGFSK